MDWISSLRSLRERLFRSLPGAVLLAAAALLALPLQADIRTTKHNLAERYGLNASTVDEREVCVFCHFPSVVDPSGNAVQRDAAASPPQWQSTSSGYSYSIYDDIGRVGLDGSAPVGSQSVACLACHDANQAFVVSASKADHPFGVPYRGVLMSSQQRDTVLDAVRRAGTPLREAMFLKDQLGRDFRPVFESMVESRKVFWVSTNSNSLRRAKNDLPLYARRDLGVGEDVPFVECTSCHDPHTSNRQFLRVVSNDRSEICVICHVP